MTPNAVPGDRRMSFNAAATTYHRGRPPYPDEVFHLLADRCGLRPGSRVLDIGAGTGQATGPLLAAGAHVVAVEPGADLATILANSHANDRLEVVIADFETAELAGDFDLAVAAMSLHWLDPIAAIAKLGGLVRPGGSLAAWWTIYGPAHQRTLFRDQLDDVYLDLLPTEHGYLNNPLYPLDAERWRRVMTKDGWFADVTVETIEWHQTLTSDTARELWSTFPNIAELAPPDREQFLTRLGGIIDHEHGGAVDDPRTTVVYTATRSTTGPT